jgi:peroxiredoxin
MIPFRRPAFVFFGLGLLAARLAGAAEPLPGHSTHGETFNEGPRQEAHLMAGTGKFEFPITTSKANAQRFFIQGVGQLHGFWYFEAERSFRQVAKLDPECAMAYWGMAMANANNEKRAKGFLAKATQFKERTSAKEKRWIGTLEKFYSEAKDDKRDKKQRAQDFITDLDAMVQDFPDDIEAKAFLAWKLWHVKGEVPIASPMVVNALLDQVFAANPAHPAHHYRIHLWDGFKPANGLNAAINCGPAAPGIAHMWHMPGHIYSKLKRFDDAVWHQEASSRVDHAYMIANFIHPDQIHNYAHNQEWLIRNLNELGHAKAAVAMAKSLIAHPQHPNHNTWDKNNGSASYGRTRLLETLIKWELWAELLALANSPWLPPTPQPSHEVAKLKAVGLAQFHLADAPALETTIKTLASLDEKEARRAKEDAKTPAKAEPKTEAAKAEPAKPQPTKTNAAPAETKPTEPAKTKTDKAEPAKPAAAKPAPTAQEPASPKPASASASATAKKSSEASSAKPAPAPKERPSQIALKELRALHAVLTTPAEAGPKLAAAKDLDKVVAARAYLLLDDTSKAAELANQLPQDLAGALAKAAVLDSCGKAEDAKKALESARKLAFDMDGDLPATQTLVRLSAKHQLKGWREPAPKRDDLGQRPKLRTLGPVHWHPPTAPAWAVSDLDGHEVSHTAAAGKPQLLLFYLGAECSHCMDQLNAFAKQAAGFDQAGISLQAISPQKPADAVKAHDRCTSEGGFPFALLSDPTLAAFKSLRAFDDFEGEALHATVLIDGQNRLRWIDVSYQPFMDAAFLLKEAKRLLALPAEP